MWRRLQRIWNRWRAPRERCDPGEVGGPFRVRGASPCCAQGEVDQEHLAVAGRWLLPRISCALAGHPAGPSSLPARRPPPARPCGRLGKPALVGFAPLPNGGHRCFPAPSAPVSSRRPPLLGFADPGKHGRSHVRGASAPSSTSFPTGALPAVLPPLRRRAAKPSSRNRPRRFARPRRFHLPRTRGLVASRCRSWGSMRFCPRLRGASPANPAIAGEMRCWTREPGGFPHRLSYPSENSPSPQPWRVTALVASSDFETTADPRPFPHPRFQECVRRSYRQGSVPRGLAPRGGPYHRALLRVQSGLSSLGLVPLRGRLRPTLAGWWTRMAPCATLLPRPAFRCRLRPSRAAFAAETRSVP